MISRRAFLSALCALPLVGKYIPKPEPSHVIDVPNQPWQRVYDEWVPMTVAPSEGGGQIFITNRGNFYEFEVRDKVPYRIVDAHITRRT